MKLIVKRYYAAPNLWSVVDEDSNKVLYVNIYKHECENYVIENQPNLQINPKYKKLYFENVKNWNYWKIREITLHKENKKIKGIVLYFKKLNKEELNYINHFKNTKIVTIAKQYAPEIKYIGVVIYNKCIR